MGVHSEMVALWQEIRIAKGHLETAEAAFMVLEDEVEKLRGPKPTIEEHEKLRGERDALVVRLKACKAKCDQLRGRKRRTGKP